MPAVAISWDLFIVVFFAVMMSLSFIIGRDKTIRLIVAAYIGTIATQGIGDVVLRLVGNPSTAAQSVGIPMDATLLALGKMLLFALCILVFTVRSGIEVSSAKEGGRIFRMTATGLLGFSAAGLIASTLLAYAAGSDLVIHLLPKTSTALPSLQGSTLLELLITNQPIWFALPAFVVVIVGCIRSE